MNNSRIPLILLYILLTGLIINPLSSQIYREGNYFYFQGSGALAAYYGDLSKANEHESMFGFGFLGGIGYQFTPLFSLGLDYRIGDYPRTVRLATGDFTRKHTTNLYSRFNLLPNSSVSPYILGGIGMTFWGTYDNDPEFDPAFGLYTGLGLDIHLSDWVTLFIQGSLDIILDDEAVDGIQGDDGYDVLGYYGAGIRLAMKRSFSPVRLIDIRGPDHIEVREEADFIAAVDEKATRPVTYRWDFGDGTSAEGTAVSHRYNQPGTYTVGVTASNRRSTLQQRYQVVVSEMFKPVAIRRLTVDNPEPGPYEVISFSTDVEGSTPISYNWDFGDGRSSTFSTPIHHYREPGEYRVTLRTSNIDIEGNEYQTERQISINVGPTTPPLARLHTIYFGFNSSILESGMHRLLNDNVELLKKHPDMCVQIKGFTDKTGPLDYNIWLSQRRAESVMHYYIQNGIARERLSIEGLGEAPEPCPSDYPGPGCREKRRAESIPVKCN